MDNDVAAYQDPTEGIETPGLPLVGPPLAGRSSLSRPDRGY